MIANRLQFDSIKFDILHPGQFGGVKKHCTMADANLILVDIINEARNQGKVTTCLAIDIAQFFPSINHELMAVMLEKLGFPLEIVILLLTELLQRQKNKIQVVTQHVLVVFSLQMNSRSCLHMSL